MVDGDRFDFTYQKIVIPPHLSEFTHVNTYSKNIFNKMPEPKGFSSFEEIIEKAKTTNKTIYIDANLL